MTEFTYLLIVQKYCQTVISDIAVNSRKITKQN